MAIISELCGNWNGDKSLLWDMVKASADCGAKIVKIQTFYAKDLAQGWESDIERIKALELTPEDHVKFVELCKECGVTPMTSVYSEEYLPMLGRAGFKWVKVGSAQARDVGLIETAIAMGFKVIVSTGGNLVVKLPSVLMHAEAVLHCVSLYPHNHNQAGLGRMLQLKGRFPYTNIGFSDHSDPSEPYWSKASEMALTLGAKYIERHFTLLDACSTKDGVVSVNREQLATLCAMDRINYQAIGTSKYSDMGWLTSPQSDSEVELIARYRTRWVKNKPCTPILEG